MKHDGQLNETRYFHFKFEKIEQFISISKVSVFAGAVVVVVVEDVISFACSHQCDQIGWFIALWQLFKASGNNYFVQIAHILRQLLLRCPKSFIFTLKYFLGNFYRHLAIFYWSLWLWRKMCVGKSDAKFAFPRSRKIDLVTLQGLGALQKIYPLQKAGINKFLVMPVGGPML